MTNNKYKELKEEFERSFTNGKDNSARCLIRDDSGDLAYSKRTSVEDIWSFILSSLQKQEKEIVKYLILRLENSYKHPDPIQRLKKTLETYKYILSNLEK